MTENEDIANCMETLTGGGVILYPTETVWGLGCDAKNEEAVQKIFHLKKRAETKMMVILLDRLAAVKNYAKTPSEDLTNLINTSSRPLTVIYPLAKNIAANLIGADKTIAIRVTTDPFCKKLIAAFGGPIVSTSANVSEQPTPLSFSEIEQEIQSGVDYIVQQRQHEKSSSAPSRIVKWTDEEELIVIRE